MRKTVTGGLALQLRGRASRRVLLRLATRTAGAALSGGAALAEEPPDGLFLWGADHEGGDMRDWWHPEPARVEGNNCGGEYNSEGGETGVTTEVVRGGRYAAFLHLPNARSGQQGTRLFRWCEPQRHRELYYGCWYYFPRRYRVDWSSDGWWNIMQWKSRGSFNGKFGLNVDTRPDGEMHVFLGRGGDSGGGRWEQDVADVPVERWFHMEAYYRKAADDSGRITVWQNGVQILDLDGVQTANSDDLGWSVNNYGAHIDPGDVWVYVDDATISTSRVGLMAEGRLASAKH